MNKNETTLIFQNRHIKVELTLPQWDCDLETIMDAVQQLLMAAGYHPDNVREYFNQEK